MRRPVSTVRLRYLSQSGVWPSGNPRLYLSVPGRPRVPMPDAPKNSAEFLRAYTDAMAGKTAPKAGTWPAGSIGAAITAYLASDHYLTRAASTRAVWRRMLDDMARSYGRGSLAGLEARHIRADLHRLAAHPANNRLKVWRALGRWCVHAGQRETDFTFGMVKRDTPRSDGHTPWTASDADMFRAHWPIGTAQRLAFELMIHTGASRSDVVRLGPGNITADGWLQYRRAKSRSLAVVPWSCPAPAWFPASPYVLECVAAAPRALTWLCTAQGRPRSAKAFGAWFARAANAAGIEHGKTAHGVRKLLAVTMAERGAAPDQRMAILGHDSTAQTLHYSAAADARAIISGTGFSNSVQKLENGG